MASAPIGTWDTAASVAGNHYCQRCGGTGRFKPGPGKLSSAAEICFRCAGKGYHDQADRKRNLAFDRYQLKRAAAAMARETEQASR